MHFLNNSAKDKWIEDYVERGTTGTRKQVGDAEAAVQQEQEDMKHTEVAGMTNRELKSLLRR